LDAVLNNTTPLSDSTMPYLNLLMFLQKYTNNTDSAQLRLKTQAIIDKLVGFTKVPANGSLVFGDSMYSGQMYTSNSNSKATYENAVKNNLPIYDTKACDVLLRAYYNITDDDEILYVTNNFDQSLSSNGLNSYTLTAYDSGTRTKLDINLCQNISQSVEIPLSNQTGFNLTQINQLKDQGYNVFDQNDPLFTDRCSIYIDKSTGMDTSLTWRRNHLYQQRKPMCIGINCTLQGVSENSYIKCNCTGLQSDSQVFNEIFDSIISSVSELNVGITVCYFTIPVRNT
jgi:hypothetical protein